MPDKIEINTKAILLLIAILVGTWLVYFMLDIIFLLFISFILMSALRPAVNWIEKEAKFNKLLSITIVYVVLILIMVLFGSFMFPPLIKETISFFRNLPENIINISAYFNIDINAVVDQIAQLGQNIGRITLKFFSSIVAILAILVFTFYFLLERSSFKQYLIVFLGNHLGGRSYKILEESEARMGLWVRSQFILMVLVGLVTYIGLVLLKVPFALPLALTAGVLEIVPIIGPNVAGILGILVAFTVSPATALFTGIFYFITQQVQNSFLLPVVMKETTGIPPLVSLLALMVGGRLAGPMGAILAVPVVLVGMSFVKEIVKD